MILKKNKNEVRDEECKAEEKSADKIYEDSLKLITDWDKTKLTLVLQLEKSREAILNAAKEHLSENQYTLLTDRFDSLRSTLFNYLHVMQNRVTALQNERNTMIKIDPAIAGGLAQGVAGLGAGLYAASEAAAAEERRKVAHAQAKDDAWNTKFEAERIEKRMAALYKEILEIVSNSLPALMAFDKMVNDWKVEERKAAQRVKNKRINYISVFLAIVLGSVVGVFTTELIEYLPLRTPVFIAILIVMFFIVKTILKWCCSEKGLNFFGGNGAFRTGIGLLIVGLAIKLTEYTYTIMGTHSPEDGNIIAFYMSHLIETGWWLHYPAYIATKVIVAIAIVLMVAGLVIRKDGEVKANETKPNRVMNQKYNYPRLTWIFTALTALYFGLAIGLGYMLTTGFLIFFCLGGILLCLLTVVYAKEAMKVKSKSSIIIRIAIGVLVGIGIALFVVPSILL